jgi:NADH-quinone oxidoreductase subunit J
MDWIGHHWLDWAALLSIATGVWWLMPRAALRPKVIGVLLALAGTGLLATRVDDISAPDAETALFWLFSGTAIIGAVIMITNRNPVYSALWFAVVTLNVCGLFLLQYAPFLAAATVIVYAGAIVVTFVFVIMLAQQSGATAYDQRSRQPLAATVASFALLAAIVGTLTYVQEHSDVSGSPDSTQASRTGPVNAATSKAESLRISAVRPQLGETRIQESANPFSQLNAGDSSEAIGRMHALGRSLFGDYLFAVELAGTLLLIATIGAIAIAPRRRGGTL